MSPSTQHTDITKLSQKHRGAEHGSKMYFTVGDLYGNAEAGK
jgi:hypothetical protein